MGIVVSVGGRGIRGKEIIGHVRFLYTRRVCAVKDFFLCGRLECGENLCL